MEPTRNAWVSLAAWLRAKGAAVVLVPAEQFADLRDYYNKHAKTDRLDSRVLARLPLLHPEGLRPIEDLGPAEPLRRAVRHRVGVGKTGHGWLLPYGGSAHRGVMTHADAERRRPFHAD